MPGAGGAWRSPCPDPVPLPQELRPAGCRQPAEMAEESSSGSSSSPSPGDTLPWNLAKHQRTKRTKATAGNGTVLDPAERAVIRIAGRAGGTGGAVSA